MSENNIKYNECSRCHRFLPLDKYHFYICKYHSSGFHSECKECLGYSFGYKPRPISETKIIDGVEYKKCTKCNEWLVNSNDFYQYERKPKLSASCKKCTRKCQKQREQTLEYKEHMKEYRKSEKYKHTRKLIKHRRRERENNTVNDFTLDEWKYALNYWSDNDGNIRCSYCDSIIRFPQMDHVIPVSKGGSFTKTNIVPAGGIKECACNQSKHDLSIDEFFEKSFSFTEELFIKIKTYIKNIS